MGGGGRVGTGVFGISGKGRARVSLLGGTFFDIFKTRILKRKKQTKCVRKCEISGEIPLLCDEIHWKAAKKCWVG